MAFQAGKDAVFKLDDGGGTLRDISTYVDNVDLPQELTALDSTTYGKAAHTFIPGLKNATISVSGKWDSTATTGPDAVIGASDPATTRTFEFGPEGGTVGKVRYTGECIRTSYRVSAPHDGIVTFTLDLQVTDTVTRNTF